MLLKHLSLDKVCITAFRFDSVISVACKGGMFRIIRLLRLFRIVL